MKQKNSNSVIMRAISVSFVSLIVFIGAAFAGEMSIRPYWVFFTDKGYDSRHDMETALSTLELDLSSRAAARRAKLGKYRLVDEQDLHVSDEYTRIIEEIAGRKIRHTSRWLNAVSCDLSEEMVTAINNLRIVKRVTPVRSFIRQAENVQVPELPEFNPPRRDHQLDYGRSLQQAAFINVPDLHDLGYRGRGILMGLMDAGFNNLDHVCFEDLDVVAAYDFVNDDDNVGDEDDMGDGDHGTKTLSIIAGFDPEQMIGIAHEASFVLAKTENTDWERQVEEDAWVAAVEWMDTLGVEVVSSSLTYMDWYDYEDLDGNTAITTIAADRAAAVGMVIVCSAGNSGNGHYPRNKIGSPADGDSVFAIGATNADSVPVGFSSQGPSYDGRIKPDFTTFGTSVRVASSIRDDGYAAGAGTSFSAPAIAGLCALLIQAQPMLTPITLRQALRETSSRSDDPDTLAGWGIPDGVAALHQVLGDVVTMLIPLRPGWNMISHNLDDFFELELAFSQLVERENVFIVKDEHGLVYLPAFGLNQIPIWERRHGYQVRMHQRDTLSLEGSLSAYTSPIYLTRGWHIVSYLPDFPMSPETAFTSLTDDGVLWIVKDRDGRFYMPGLDFDNIGVLNAGFGYQLRVIEDAELIYPRQRIAHADDVLRTEPEYFKLPEPGEQNMSVLFIAGKGISDGDEIGCFGKDGRLVGSGRFLDSRCGVALWGEENCEFPVVNVYKHESDIVLSTDLEWIQGTISYIPDEFAAIRINVEESTEAESMPGPSISATPNPFNDGLTLQYNIPLDNDIELSIFNMMGRSVLNRSIRINGNTDNKITIDTDRWSSGSYIVLLKSESFRITLKIDHVK